MLRLCQQIHTVCQQNGETNVRLPATTRLCFKVRVVIPLRSPALSISVFLFQNQPDTSTSLFFPVDVCLTG